MPYIDGQVLYAADLESRFAQYLATGGLSALITSMLAQPDAASVRAVLGVGSATLGGTNGQLLYNNSGVQGGVTLGGDATLNASTGVLTIAANVISNSKLALMASTTIKSNITGSAAVPTDNTLTAIIDAAISSVQGSFLVRKGTGWSAIGPGTAGQFPVSAGAGADPVMGTWLGGTITNPLNLSAVPINKAKASAVASGATTDIWTGVLGNYLHVTGTTTITSFGTAPQAGAERVIVFDNILTLTHNAVSLILPNNGDNIVTQPGDVAFVTADTTSNMKVTSYLRANGTLVRMATQVSTSGTSVDFTSIPSGVKRITISYNGVSTNGASLPQIQIGSGSFSTSGYFTQSHFSNSVGNAQAASSSGFVIYDNTPAAANILFGSIVLIYLGGNIWQATGTLLDASRPGFKSFSGVITLGGVLDRVRNTTVNGTDTFDAGSIGLLYE